MLTAGFLRLQIAEWLALPGNEDEFLVLYLDDQRDIFTWVRSFQTAMTFGMLSSI